MEPSLTQPTVRRRAPLSALTKLTSAALVGMAGAIAYAQIRINGEFDPILTTFAVIMLVVAAVITRGWRFMPLIGAVLSIMVVAGNRGPVIYDVTHPETFHLFAFMVVAVALALIGTVAGVSATVQNYGSQERPTPRSMVPALAALAGLCLGAILVAALPRDASAGVDPSMLAGFASVTMPDFRFEQTELTAKAGELVARWEHSSWKIIHLYGANTPSNAMSHPMVCSTSPLT